MQFRTEGQTNTKKPKNVFAVIPLIIFTVVSAAPHNALAFESDLANQDQGTFYAPIRVVNATNQESIRIAAVATQNSPITIISEKPEPAPVVAIAAPQIQQIEKIYPTSETPVVLEGEASYYSRAGCLGCDPLMIMANGQPLDDNALTMAIGADKKHLVGYHAKVTSLATGQSVVVKITDTGGFYQAKYGHRVADLTVATKNAIGMRGGVGQVRVEVF